ncbi:type II toxin-antitoxin system VapC family toxin [Sphingomonas soli]|uniref:type II toxin-antitoxin system VapC family toxin n=1 Tax=Sphingomonas soli TaxID=266127 RepID=UPI00082F9517|nr:type II toxin-antitoxin system VapC family toxin [Sphingomonas soli]
MIVLDTNVLSEALRPAPDARVMHWLGGQAPAALFVTAVTQSEILYGIAILDPGRRRDELQAAATAMFAEDFAGRILGFDPEAAPQFAGIAAERRRLGRPISQFDAQIAAIARSRGASLATRNLRDFEGCGIELIDPWSFG